MIDPSRNLAVWTWDAKGEAFGNNPPNQDPDQDGTAFVFDMRFPGQRFDAATGLNYNYFRDYDAGTGRYVQSDPIGLRGGVNTFSYTDASPLSSVDPFGLLRALLMVGDPGLGIHNPGRSFELAAATVSTFLASEGWTSETIRVSSVSDFSNALLTGAPVDRAYYFGHAGASALMIGEGAGEGTNLFAEDAKGIGPGRMSNGAEFYIYGCNAGVGDSNIARTLSYYLQRPVNAFTSGMHYTSSPQYSRAPPYPAPPSRVPLYMRPDNGKRAIKFNAYKGR